MFVDPYLGTMTVFAGNFAPRAWMFCQGQLLAIAQYDALFALIGTTYGGDGQTTFGLPDLRSRVANHQGQGPGLSNYILGQMSGTESVTLTTAQCPGHSHQFISITGTAPATSVAGTLSSASNAVPAGVQIYSNSPDGGTMNANLSMGVTVPAGGSQPFSLLQPVLAMNYIIAVEGIFPSRN
jgi:microcystin-dependent protein